MISRKMKELIARDRLQYLIFTGASLGILGCTGILYVSNPMLFQRFIGHINPLLTGCFLIVLGGLVLSFLVSQNWFAIYKNLNGIFRASGIAALFGVIMIVVDMKVIFPADINILFPASLLFYPAMGFFVELLFHVLPFGILVFVLHSMLMKTPSNTILWMCMPIVALLEPMYHVMNMVSSNQYPVRVVLYVGLHIFGINFFQVLMFKQYDFISMYSLRLVYYLFWHIGWGYIRLRVLFS
jgi:hypothetical protein